MLNIFRVTGQLAGLNLCVADWLAAAGDLAFSARPSVSGKVVSDTLMNA